MIVVAPPPPKPHPGEIIPPPDALKAPDAQEVVRFWIGGNRGHVSLLNPKPANAGPGQEGILGGIVIADIARHAVRALRHGAPGLSEDRLVQQITTVFLDELGMNVPIEGGPVDPGATA